MNKLIQNFFLILLLGFSRQASAQTWLPALGQGVDDAPYAFVNAMIEYQGNLVITGEFNSVSGVACTYVAMWNGSSWQAMGSGLPAVGKTLAIYNGELYAGCDGIGVSTLQKWNGTSWQGSGPFTDPILTLYVDNATNDFYAGGYFTSPGKYVAKFNGTSWSGMGNLAAGTSSFPGVMAISVYNGNLYVGGTFGGGTTAQYVAKWNGTIFSGLAADQPNQPVAAFAQQDGKLYIGGAFSKIGNTSMRCVAVWEGSAYGAMASDASGPNTAFGGVKTLASYQGQIYAGGVFSLISITGLTANNVARWNGCQWKNLTDGATSPGTSDEVYSMIVMGQDLVIGGKFKDAGGITNTNRVARWNNIVECPDPMCFDLNPQITISSDIAQGCAGSTFNFTSTVSNEGSAPVYQWFVDGAPVGSNSPSFSSSSLTDGQVVTCQLTSNDPCAPQPNGTSNAVTISIVTQLTPAITITTNTPTVCSGQSVTFSSTASNGGTNPTYTWMVNGTPVGGNPGASYSTTTLNNGDQVSCEFFSSESCASPSTVISNTLSMTVIASVTPSVSITTPFNSSCAGTAVQFTATPVNGGTPAYQWKVNGTNAGTNSAFFSTSALTDGQTVTCDMTSTATCATPQTATSNGITMSILSTVDVTFNGTDLSSTTVGTSYQWFDCNTNQPIAGASSATFTPATSGSYRLEVTTASGCTVASSCQSVTVGLEENMLGLQLYPVPANDVLHLKWTASGVQQIALIDLNGKVLQSIPVNGQSCDLDVESLGKGVYLLEIKINEINSYTQKFIK